MNAEAEHSSDAAAEKDAETFLLLFGSFRSLLQVEVLLMHKVMGSDSSGSGEPVLFHLLVQQPLKFVLDQGDTMTQFVRKCLAKQEHWAVMNLYPVSKYIHANYDSLEPLSKNAGPELNAKFKEICRSVDSLCAKGLEDFIENVKNDQDKFVPKDATVHQVTSNTCIYLEQLIEFQDTLQPILSDGTADGMKTAVPKIFARILSALGLNIQNKASGYTDLTHKNLFLLNNYNHILKSLSKSGVLKIVCEQNREVEGFYQSQIKDHKKRYLLCWNRVVGTLSEFRRERPSDPQGGLVDKDKDQLKAAFLAWNKEFETTTGVHRGLSVPDAQLAAQLRREARDTLLPVYEPFFRKYYACGFTKNAEKYVKFTPETVSQTIERLFDTHAL